MPPKTIFSKVREKKRRVLELRDTEAPRRTQKQRAKTGLEAEFFILDSEGRVSNKADQVLKKHSKNKKEMDLQKECGHNVLEINVVPRIYLRNVAQRFLSDVRELVSLVESLDLHLYPFAVYPGIYGPDMRSSAWYGVKERIFGKDKWNYAGRCTGFHLHYSLPSSVFNEKEGRLKLQAPRSAKQRTLNEYNFAIAADPALTVFTQSSPLYMGKFMAKDSRLLLYRGGEALDYDGLYSQLPEFGQLPRYKVTYEALVDEIEERHASWSSMMKKAGASQKKIDSYKLLDFNWTPVKINKVTTLEQRGLDLNLPSVMMAASILSKYMQKAIQREDIVVASSPEAIKSPFSFHDNVIHVPPFWYLSLHLQKEAATKGMDSDAVFNYCKSFYGLCMRFVNKKYMPALKPVKNMLKKRKTTSDWLLEWIARKGYDAKETVPSDVLRELCLEYSSRLTGDVTKTEKLMKTLEESKRD